MFWKYKKTMFKYLDRLLDDEQWRMFESQRSIDRSHELHDTEQKMINELHKLLGG